MSGIDLGGGHPGGDPGRTGRPPSRQAGVGYRHHAQFTPVGVRADVNHVTVEARSLRLPGYSAGDEQCRSEVV